MRWRRKKNKEDQNANPVSGKVKIKVEPYTTDGNYYHILYKKPRSRWKEFQFASLKSDIDSSDIGSTKIFRNFGKTVEFAKSLSLEIILNHEMDQQVLYDDHIKKLKAEMAEKQKTFEIEI